MTLQAIATATGHTQSAVGSATYTIQTPTATPTFSPGSGNYSGTQSVTISDSTGGATIYYTTTGATPTTSSTRYAGPISVSSSMTLQAIATATGHTQSAVGSATYTIQTPTATPTFSPAGGTYNGPVDVAIASATTGATVRFTTNGADPSPASSLYGRPFTLVGPATVKARAFKSGMADSAVASATYTIPPVKDITVGETQLTSLSSTSDVNWRRISLSQSAEVVVVLSGPVGDTQMWLYGPNSTADLVAYDDDSGPGLFSRIDRRGAQRLQAGIYYVKVTSRSTFGIPSYTIAVRAGDWATPFSVGTWQSQTPVSGDSFRVLNTTGVCVGMSTYSKWYFDRQSDAHGPLFTHFTTDAQSQIASQAHLDTMAGNVQLSDVLLNSPNSSYAAAEDLIADLQTQHSPQILFMSKMNFAQGLTWQSLWQSFLHGLGLLSPDSHAVLVIGYQPSTGGGQFQIYNNWYTDKASTLTYSANGGLSGFSDNSDYKYFVRVPASLLYGANTFTSVKYPGL
jgi:hypothetical protein